MRNPILLVAVLVVLLASAGIALAQEEPAITGVAGVLERPGYTSDGYGPYAITDEATGASYVVDGGWEYLDSSVGYRVIVYGPVLEGYDPPVLRQEMTYHAPAGEQPDQDLLDYGICTKELRQNAPEADLNYCTATVYLEAEPSL